MKELILRSQFVGDFLFWSCSSCLKNGCPRETTTQEACQIQGRFVVCNSEPHFACKFSSSCPTNSYLRTGKRKASACSMSSPSLGETEVLAVG